MKQDDIFRAIQLSYLNRDEKECAALHTDVEKILSFVAAVRSIDTPATATSSARVNVFRDDVVTIPAGTYREQMLARAPETFKNWFLSKKIL